MVEPVSSLLKRVGPCLTSDLIREYEALGLSPVAARKRVNRAGYEVTKLAGLRFSKNARFIYLDAQFGKDPFWEGLERAFQAAGKSYWCALVALRARGGQCLAEHFPIISGAPAARKGQMSPDRIFERLEAIQMLRKVEGAAGESARIMFRPMSFHIGSETELNALLLAESVVLHGLREWVRRFGFGSYNKVRTRSDPEGALVSGIAWDLSAPSFVRPLMSVSAGKVKNGFFVCDVNLEGVISKDYVEAFVRKHDMASAPMAVGAIMPMLVGHVFAEDAFSLGKQKGILMLTVGNMFGEDISRALKELVALLCDLGARAAVDPKKIEAVMSVLTKFEGAATNVRAALFEVVIGSLVKEVEGGYLKIGEKKVNYADGREIELDVQLDRGKDDGVLVIECKSKIPGARVGLEEVRKWYEDRVPLAYAILSNDGAYDDKPFRFEFWTNGPINDDAVEWLEAQNHDFIGFSTGWRDGEAVKAYAGKAASSIYRKLLKEHYFNHPLSKVARAARSAKAKPAPDIAPEAGLA